MMDKTLADLSQEEFDGLMDQLCRVTEDDLTDEEFFGALAAMDDLDESREPIHLKLRIENGQVMLAESRQVRVKGSEFWIAGERISLELEKAA
jgi:hypothetical protein